ncbi:MAG: transposase [Acidobacteriota bacterium]
MKDRQNVTYRYSLAFRQKVVSEIETGKLSKEEARRLYGIGGGETINKWIKKFGKNHLLNKVVRIEMNDEVDQLRKLKREKQELESALAQAHLENLALRGLIAAVEKEYKIDVKKNFGSQQSKKRSS